MAASSAKSLPTVGFISVCQQSDRSVVGGYLVLNAAGRPVEFHCTAPVRPSRAQEILYGPTLKTFLHGEQIAKTLAGKAACDPLFLCTDSEAVLALRNVDDTPIVLMADDSDIRTAASAADSRRIDGPHSGPPRPAALVWFTLGQQKAAVLSTHAGDRETIQQRWRAKVEGLDLREPFARIREALEEAQKTAAR
jgi:hypothetical protein